MNKAAPDWDDLDRRAEALIAAAQDAVVRWEWARSSADWEMPFELWEQRFGRNPVTKAAAGSSDPALSVQYGYDRDDQIVLARRFTDTGRKVVPDSERVWTDAIGGAPILVEIKHRRRPDGWHAAVVRCVIVPEPQERGRAPKAVTTFWRPGSGVVWQRERYDRGEGGRVERIVYTGSYDEDHVSGAHKRTLEYVATYDDLGGLESVSSRLVSDTSGEKAPTDASVQWVRSTAAAVRDAEAFLARELPARIVEWVRRSDPKQPVYALALLYDADDGAGWMPSLALATVQHVQHLREQSGGEDVEEAWNPATFPVFDAEPQELTSPDMLAAFRVTGQAWGERFPRKVGSLLKKVAKDVGHPARAALAEPIGEFAAYAAELEDDFATVARTAFGAKAQRAILDL